MKNFFNKIFLDPIFSSLLTVLAGVLITIFHKMALDIVCIALGCLATVLGLINIVKYFRAPEDSRYNLLTGLIFGALGLNIIFYPNTLTDLVAVAFGIIILYHGIVNCQNAIMIKRSGYQMWYLSIIFSSLTIVAGLLLILLKNVFVDYLAAIIGITLIVEGALNTWTAIKVKKSNE